MALGRLWAGRAYGTNTGNVFVKLEGKDAALDSQSQCCTVIISPTSNQESSAPRLRPRDGNSMRCALAQAQKNSDSHDENMCKNSASLRARVTD